MSIIFTAFFFFQIWGFSQQSPELSKWKTLCQREDQVKKMLQIIEGVPKREEALFVSVCLEESYSFLSLEELLSFFSQITKPYEERIVRSKVLDLMLKDDEYEFAPNFFLTLLNKKNVPLIGQNKMIQDYVSAKFERLSFDDLLLFSDFLTNTRYDGKKFFSKKEIIFSIAKRFLDERPMIVSQVLEFSDRLVAEDKLWGGVYQCNFFIVLFAQMNIENLARESVFSLIDGLWYEGLLGDQENPYSYKNSKVKIEILWATRKIK